MFVESIPIKRPNIGRLPHNDDKYNKLHKGISLVARGLYAANVYLGTS